MRAGGVTAFALDRDRDPIRCQHHGTWPEVKRFLRFPRLIVQAEDRVAREALEKTVVQHPLRAAVDARFLGGLKDEVERTWGLSAGSELHRGAQ